MYRVFLGSLAAWAIAGASCPAIAQTAAAPEAAVLFTNVRIFDGKSEELSATSNVLVRGNTIAKISQEPIATDRRADTKIIDGAGRTLMPGLIDAHAHMAMSTIPLALMMTSDSNYSMLRQAKAAEEMLLRGFTSARDLGGPTFGLKRAIDEGFVVGPRIWPAGTQSLRLPGTAISGRSTTCRELRRSAAFTEKQGFTAIADGTTEVLRRVRENLMQGASQIKLMAGGGVASNYDPLDVSQYTEEEMRAAVQAAADWGTYVTVHAYTPVAIKKAIAAGVKCIDHGQLADEESDPIDAGKRDLVEYAAVPRR